MPRPITIELYEKVLRYFRENPGDAAGCAISCGIHVKTARRLWKGPQSRLWPYAVPASIVIQKERAEKEARDEREKEKTRLALAEQSERAKKLHEDAMKFEENGMQVARVDTIQGLAACSQMGKGIGVLAKRIGQALETADSKTPVDVHAGTKLIKEWVAAVRSLTETASTLIAIDRAAANLPKASTVLEVASATVEDATREVEAAQRALARATARGLVVHEGGGGR